MADSEMATEDTDTDLMAEQDEIIAYDWPERQQIAFELRSWLLADSHNPRFPCFLVYGRESTGKSTLVRYLVQLLHLRHAYILCSPSHQPRDVFTSMVGQLGSKKRKLDDGYCSPASCDSASDFAVQLEELAAPPHPPSYLILDDAHLLGRSTLLPSILAACEAASIAAGARVVVVLVSRFSWGSGEFMGAARHLPALFVPPHTPEQMEALLVRWRPPGADEQLYRTFVQAEVLGTFRKLTVSCRDLQALAEDIWPRYIAPMQQEQVKKLAGRPLHMTLHQAVQPYIKKLLGSYEPASGCVQLLDAEAGRQVLDFELPYMAKWVLLSAYIASRNKASTDGRVFGAGRGRRSKRGRGRRGMAHQRQGDATTEAVLKGPHPFPHERLMTIYHHLLDAHFGNPNDPGSAAPPDVPAAAAVATAGDDAGSTPLSLRGTGREEGLDEGSAKILREAQCADVATHVTSLVSLKLLSLVSDDVLQAPRYRCHAPEELIQQLARNVDLTLSEFLCVGQH